MHQLRLFRPGNVFSLLSAREKSLLCLALLDKTKEHIGEVLVNNKNINFVYFENSVGLLHAIMLYVRSQIS